MNRLQLTLAKRRALLGWLFIMPWLLGFVILFAVPFMESIRFSFSKLEVNVSGFDLNFIGWHNYVEALYINPAFNRILTESVMNMVVNVPLILFFSLFSAVLINQRFRGRALARALFFLPVILASGAISSAELSGLLTLMNGNTAAMAENGETLGAAGLMAGMKLKTMLLESGMPEAFIGYIVGAVSQIYEIISSSGVQILIFLAALQSIPSSMYEVAKMEGATGYEIFWKITLPMVSPLILTNIIYTIIDSFAGSQVTAAITSTAFEAQNFGLSSAMAWLYTLVISVILVVVGIFVSRKVFYYN
ncbi:carbohydrate ABC transporter permease [Paenibacillus sp. GCM10027626]|uniref:carbohydrate ABC transporter permease n=1 Tax=Paenibacillus sp. GCM10027626 TaxID=3273411 RepID=UPI00363E6F94